MDPELSYCVVNTNGRAYLVSCLAAIERTHPAGVMREVLVLDNASTDGSADVARGFGSGIELIERERRAGKAANDSLLMERAKGRYCLLLNEDSELKPGTAAVLMAALEEDPRAAAATPQLLDSNGAPYPCAWRFPGVGTALAGALFLHRRMTVQSTGKTTRRVDWAQSSALLVRREAAAQIGFMDPDFFVYYDECDFAKRLADAGWHELYVPGASAVHHDQLSSDLAAGLARSVEFHRNRDLYMRKHHGRLAALAVRVLTAWSYAARALAATVIPGEPAEVYRAHARQALFPARGAGIRDRTEAPKQISLPLNRLSNEDLIAELTRRLVVAAPGAKVILFGSRSRGEHRPNSDVDLLVIQPDEVERPAAETFQIRRQLRGLGVGLDVILVSRKHVEDWGHFEGSLLQEVLSEGRVLIDP